MDPDMRGKTVMAAFAHPDDESFGTGGTLAALARAGATILLVTATRGDAGEISDPALATPETLAEVRERELRCSCDALGIAPPIILGYRDSGMAGTADNEREGALAMAAPDEVTGRMVGLVREHRPDVLITFDPKGGYGHPDHITIHKAAMRAFREAGDPERFPEQLGELRPHVPGRLLWVAIPRARLMRVADEVRAAGHEMPLLSETEEIGTPDEQVHLEIDVWETLDMKMRSLECHATQANDQSPWRVMPEAEVRAFFSTEHFTQVSPRPERRLTGTAAAVLFG